MKVEILGICLTPFPIKWAGKAAKQVYHKLRQKDKGSDATSRTFLQGEGSVLVQPLSLLRASSPKGGALGEGKRHLYNQKSPRHDAERAGGFSYKAEGCGNSPPWGLVI